MKQVQKFKVYCSKDGKTVVHDFTGKGLAFALAKTKAPQGNPFIEVQKFVAIQKSSKDRLHWRKVKRWLFYPDGQVQIAA